MGLFHKDFRELLHRHIDSLVGYVRKNKQFFDLKEIIELDRLDEDILVDVVKLHEKYLDDPATFNQLVPIIKSFHEELITLRRRGRIGKGDQEMIKEFVEQIEHLAGSEIKEVREQTLQDFKRLGLNPNYFKSGLRYIFNINSNLAGIYSNVHYLDPVIKGQLSYLPKRFRFIQLNPNKDLMKVGKYWEEHECYGRILVHEMLHDIYYAGGISVNMRNAWVELIKQTIFVERKFISWYKPRKKDGKDEYNLKCYAAELFAIAADMVLLGRTVDIPGELVSFIDRLSLG